MTTILEIPHENLALELCVRFVKEGKTFRCTRTKNGWEFEVVNPNVWAKYTETTS